MQRIQLSENDPNVYVNKYPGTIDLIIKGE